ncbi:BlaI/MecI/CopY family transcriptional regulator [Sphingomonas sp. Root241]|jgi:predicted transcriptional regulator|uniref:BlaI/MecI/CopY family transcriptional regulator n=1 Tax=Sphingomonas sp. Root241 TaxID=1736501 RepID=UPI0006F93550|nr:BlaI/MecI/CopY family transcriptional regulator [Sphingomonas sp. Root241]KRC82493.1 transcriptional regulator [Sphingomonas sp. Root241]
MLSQLPPRERQIVDLLYEGGARTVSDICDALPDRLTGSAVRAMLKRLEDKGFVRREESDRGFLFSPTLPDSQARRTALSQVVRTFFNGSPVSAASALLGMAQQPDAHELDELEAMIARARKARASGE